MEEKLLSISQLAKLRKLTPETLRHYDRIGLIKPVYVDPQTKYRYYSIRQYEKIGTIKELRQLGMSLDMIVEYFNDRNLEKSTQILTKYADNMMFEIKEKLAVYHVLQKKLEFLHTLKDIPAVNVVYEKELPERPIITFGEKAGGPKEHALILTKLEWHLNEVAPILASDRVGVYADEDLLSPTENYIPAVPFLFLEGPTLASPYFKMLPTGRYLCLYYHSGNLERYNEDFELVKTYMQEHHLQVDGKILQIYKLDVTLTSSAEETIIEIQVPVK